VKVPQTFADRRPVLEALIDFKVMYDQGLATISGMVPVAAARKCTNRVGANAEAQGEHRHQSEQRV
jgi:hypothetical protein